MNSRYRRRPKSRVDSERIKIILCRYCRAKITFGYNSVGRDGKKLACNLDGTAHKCDEMGGRK